MTARFMCLFMLKIQHPLKVIEVRLPASMQLKVIETGEAAKGNTQGAVTKPATVETGAVIKVPAFIKEGEIVIVNTETDVRCIVDEIFQFILRN